MSTAKHLPPEPSRPSHLRAVESDESLSLPDPHEAWRSGRPLEDPEKTKRWGIVTAKPSEYLVHMRGGRVRRRSTGQGASCFKLPWDSVAVIPTTINRLQFTADQVTLEKVGMRVTGLAVYRIVEPEIAFRMLNFSYAERASQKLADIMREMFVGATRRHVANLRVEDVMTRRKDAIAGELMAELAPVLDGRGRVDDSTSMGWGVVLDTVEIQDVRVLSEEVFANMQATYRAELAARAREAELEREATVAAREAEHERALEKARLEAEAERRRLRAAAESRSTEIELAEEGKRAALRAAAERATIEREQAERIARLQAEAAVNAEEAERLEEARRAELERQVRLLEAQQQLDAREHATALLRQEQEAARRRAQAAADQAHEDAAAEAQALLRRRELELERLAGELAAALALAQRRVEDTVSPERIQLELITRGLPAIAEACAQQIGELRVTQFGSGDDPTAWLTRGMAQVLEVARALGLRLPGTAPERAPNTDVGA
jgi:flotillin